MLKVQRKERVTKCRFLFFEIVVEVKLDLFSERSFVRHTLFQMLRKQKEQNKKASIILSLELLLALALAFALALALDSFKSPRVNL